jgi:hypothetical protein
MSTTPTRFRITRFVHPDSATPQLWLCIPEPQPDEDTRVHGLGRRDAVAPRGTVLTATWREAIDYATAGTIPRSIQYVYPEWCGLPDDWPFKTRDEVNYITAIRDAAYALAAQTITPLDRRRSDADLDDAMDWNGQMP